MKRRYLVIGLGRFGQSLVETLGEQGCEVVAIDENMANLDVVKEKVGYAVEMDATDPEALKSVDAEACQAAIVAIGEDFEAAVLVVAALKEAGVKRVVARARTPREARILLAVGASQVLELETEMGRRLGLSLATEGSA